MAASKHTNHLSVVEPGISLSICVGIRHAGPTNMTVRRKFLLANSNPLFAANTTQPYCDIYIVKLGQSKEAKKTLRKHHITTRKKYMTNIKIKNLLKSAA